MALPRRGKQSASQDTGIGQEQVPLTNDAANAQPVQVQINPFGLQDNGEQGAGASSNSYTEPATAYQKESFTSLEDDSSSFSTLDPLTPSSNANTESNAGLSSNSNANDEQRSFNVPSTSRSSRSNTSTRTNINNALNNERVSDRMSGSSPFPGLGNDDGNGDNAGTGPALNQNNASVSEEHIRSQVGVIGAIMGIVSVPALAIPILLFVFFLTKGNTSASVIITLSILLLIPLIGILIGVLDIVHTRRANVFALIAIIASVFSLGATGVAYAERAVIASYAVTNIQGAINGAMGVSPIDGSENSDVTEGDGTTNDGSDDASNDGTTDEYADGSSDDSSSSDEYTDDTADCDSETDPLCDTVGS